MTSSSSQSPPTEARQSSFDVDEISRIMTEGRSSLQSPTNPSNTRSVGGGFFFLHNKMNSGTNRRGSAASILTRSSSSTTTTATTSNGVGAAVIKTSNTTTSTSSSTSGKPTDKISSSPVTTAKQRTLVHSFSIGNQSQIKIYTQNGSKTPTPTPTSFEEIEEGGTDSVPIVTSPPETPSPGKNPKAKSLEDDDECCSSNMLTNVEPSLANLQPLMHQHATHFASAEDANTQCELLVKIQTILGIAWASEVGGRELAHVLCDDLRRTGAFEKLLKNISTAKDALKFSLRVESARTLEQALTAPNRTFLASTDQGLDQVGTLAKDSLMQRRPEQCLALLTPTIGILRHLFKTSFTVCGRLVNEGALEPIVYACRLDHKDTLRHCVGAFVNLAMLGGIECQTAMVRNRVQDWLFPLALSEDKVLRYYSCVAIALLAQSSALQPVIARAGVLRLIEPFLSSQDPEQMSKIDATHLHGHPVEWLRGLIPLLATESDPNAQSLATFHFAMEAFTKKRSQQSITWLNEVSGARESLKSLISTSTNALAAKYAKMALGVCQMEIPQVTLNNEVYKWTPKEVDYWISIECQGEGCSAVDGEMLMLERPEKLFEILKLPGGAFGLHSFRRSLIRLRCRADLTNIDPSGLSNYLKQSCATECPEILSYTYSMIWNGIDRNFLKSLTDQHLLNDCKIDNGVHRTRLLEVERSKDNTGFTSKDGGPRKYDVFISYRRATGSQLASLLKVHLEHRGFSVFLDVEGLLAGQFDQNLLASIREARHFVLVLTKDSLQRCIDDHRRRDWIHKEVVEAMTVGCNIVPVMHPEFTWPQPPELLPTDMQPIYSFNGLKWIHEYQEACIVKNTKIFTTENKRSI